MTGPDDHPEHIVPIPSIPGHGGEHHDFLEILWVYEPPIREGQQGRIHLANAETLDLGYGTLEGVATHYTDPRRLEGYAYSIAGGWRITDADHEAVKDPYVIRLLLAALREVDHRGEHPPGK